MARGERSGAREGPSNKIARVETVSVDSRGVANATSGDGPIPPPDMAHPGTQQSGRPWRFDVSDDPPTGLPEGEQMTSTNAPGWGAACAASAIPVSVAWTTSR